MGDDEMDMSTDEGGMDEGGLDEGTGMEMGEDVDPGPTIAESSMPFAPTEAEGFEGGGGGEGSDSGTAAPGTMPHAPGAESEGGGEGGGQEETATVPSAGEDFGGGKPDYFSATERGLTSAFKGGPEKETATTTATPGELDDVYKQQVRGMTASEQAPGQADVPSAGSDAEGDRDTAGVEARSQSSGAAAELEELQKATGAGEGGGGSPAGGEGSSEASASSGGASGEGGGGQQGGSAGGGSGGGGDVDSGSSYGGGSG
jgi:hypothetical protein